MLAGYVIGKGNITAALKHARNGDVNNVSALTRR